MKMMWCANMAGLGNNLQLVQAGQSADIGDQINVVVVRLHSPCAAWLPNPDKLISPGHQEQLYEACVGKHQWENKKVYFCLQLWIEQDECCIRNSWMNGTFQANGAKEEAETGKCFEWKMFFSPNYFFFSCSNVSYVIPGFVLVFVLRRELSFFISSVTDRLSTNLQNTWW